MDGIAFYSQNISITWHAVIMVLSVVSGIVTALIMSSEFAVKKYTLILSSLLSAVLAPLFARLVYWYCCPEQFAGILDALTSFGSGGYSLLGAIIGVLSGVALGAWLTGCIDRLAGILDCIAPSAALMISIGRLASAFDTADYGKAIFSDPAQQRFPISVSVTEAGGNTVWRFPTFAYEALASFLIFIVLVTAAARLHDGLINNRRFDGALAMLFGAIFSATQIVLESTRYDALFLRSNGFVSMFQIAGGVVLVAVFTIFTIRIVRTGIGNARLCIMLDAALLLLTSGIGIMEYLVQRHASTSGTFYAIMAVQMLGICVAAYMLYRENVRVAK